MKKIVKKEDLNFKQLMCVERVVANPDITHRALAKELNVAEVTVQGWRNNKIMIERIYDRFMEVVGKYLPSVIMAQVREAQAGNTNAATLVLKHTGKLETIIKHKIMSPWEQHQNDLVEIEDAEIVETGLAEVDLDQEIKLEEIPLIPRDIKNDKPKSKVIKNNKALKKSYKDIQKANNRADRYQWNKRAKIAGVDPLASGYSTKEDKKAWRELVLKAELEKGIVSKPKRRKRKK